LLDAIAEEKRCDALVELNVVEQIINVAQSTVLQDAWLRGQDVTLHGWVYGINAGLLKDLKMGLTGNDGIEMIYHAALADIGQRQR
jgi:carbonic anhydrase